MGTRAGKPCGVLGPAACAAVSLSQRWAGSREPWPPAPAWWGPVCTRDTSSPGAVRVSGGSDHHSARQETPLLHHGLPLRCSPQPTCKQRPPHCVKATCHRDIRKELEQGQERGSRGPGPPPRTPRLCQPGLPVEGLPAVCVPFPLSWLLAFPGTDLCMGIKPTSETTSRPIRNYQGQIKGKSTKRRCNMAD